MFVYYCNTISQSVIGQTTFPSVKSYHLIVSQWGRVAVGFCFFCLIYKLRYYLVYMFVYYCNTISQSVIGQTTFPSVKSYHSIVSQWGRVAVGFARRRRRRWRHERKMFGGPDTHIHTCTCIYTHAHTHIRI